MKTKFQTIQSKLILLEIFILIAGLFTAMLAFSTIGKITRNFQLLNNINNLKINVTDQNQEIFNLIESDQFNISFYKKEKTQSVYNFLTYQKQDSNLINQLLKESYIIDNLELYDKFLKLNENLNEYYKNFELLVINIRDRGLQHYGKMGDVVEISNNINQKLSTINDFIINDLMNQVTVKIEDYGKSFSAITLTEISGLSDQIISQMFSLSEQHPDLDLNELSSQFETLNTRLKIVSEKNNDIGIKNNSGILVRLKSISSELNKNLLDISEIINNEIPLINKKSTNRTFIIILFVTLLIVIYVLSLMRSLVSPIDSVKNHLLKIAQGALPDDLSLNINNEFDQIEESLNKIIDGLKLKTEFASELGKGNLVSKYKNISEKDTLGNALLTLQKSLQKAAEEDKNHKVENERRRWANEGLAKFSEILRLNNDNTEMLCDSVIKNLVKYLEASVGGIYLYNDENKVNPFLYLASAFAYDRKKFLKDRILVGEGLVGACAQEKQTIYMTEIPEEYVTITSGLGMANPRVLLIVPLNLENEVLGILEIASFNHFEKHVMEFVEKLAESIASTLASAKINERTQQLLEQSQKQAIEMSEQEEEMRQNMEELQATQEESTRKENEMYGILHAINSTSYYYETDLNGIITEINERMLFILEMQREQVVGIHHCELASMNKNSPEYISFWNQLREGHQITKIQKFESSNGNELWLKQNYTPINSKEGKTIKIICFSTDISETVQLEKDIQKAERELSSKKNELGFLNSAIDISYLKCDLGNDGRILDVNQNFERQLGFARKELIEMNIKQLIAKDQAKSFERIWENILSGQPFSNIVKYQNSGHEIRLIKSTFKPIVKDNNELIKIIFIGELYSSNIETE